MDGALTRYVMFLRGVNVGGHRKIPMSDLRRLLVGKTSGKNVRTYIASGNVVADMPGTIPDITTRVEGAILDTFGFDVPVLVIKADTLAAVVQGCPWPDAAGNRVFAYLCFADPALDHPAISELKAESEQVAFDGRVVWLHAPEGIGRSKLGARMESLLGCDATARNLNTMRKVLDIASAPTP